MTKIELKTKDYKDLRVWQTGIEIVDRIYLITDRFPKCEVYALTSQMRRAAISIPSNIAEGFVRNHSKEYKQFLYVSLGSCAELDTQMLIAKRRAYVFDDALTALNELINYEMRMLNSLIKKVRETGDERRETFNETRTTN